MAGPRDPTFKPPYWHHDASYPRPLSPVRPTFEPLSPARPIEPIFNYPASSNNQWLHSPASYARQQEWAGKSRAGPQLAYTSSRKHHRASSTIDELAQVALSVSPPQQPRPRQYSAGHGVQTYPSLIHINGYAYGAPHLQSHAERPSKRTRSDAGPSPQTYPTFSPRPSTSYYPGDITQYQQASQYGDQARRESANSSSLEDAELLVNFASRVAPRAALPKPSAHQAAMLQPSVLPQFDPNPLAASLPPLSSKASSMPSPSETLLDAAKPSMADNDRRKQQAPARDWTVQTEKTIPGLAPQQTQTPPDEESLVESGEEQGQQSTTRSHYGVEVAATLSEYAYGPHTESEKPKIKRGWPKGKPRGPRKSTGVAKPRPTISKRGRKAASTTRDSMSDAAETTSARRRKSFTDFVVADSVPETPTRASSIPADCRFVYPSTRKSIAGKKALPKVTPDTICSICNQARVSILGEHDQWISCNGCKHWLHSDCAGFQNEREVRDVDKFFCKQCEPEHGATTFVRKSSRAHTSVDYAGLNQGVLKTSDDCHEHHYIQPIKDGTFTFDPETFARIRPELATRDFFESSHAFSEPVLIPAEFNPKPTSQRPRPDDQMESFENAEEESWKTSDFEYETVPDDGQDKLDMVIPQDLTIRKVCELVGPTYPLDVIDVKIQGTESGKWNLQRWADYYEQDGEKAIRNVISLEVAHTKLGRMLRRPKVVRDIDLQDSVWPEDEPAKSVAFYCLMSVADSYTDFHIDFGGSSVYYHILKGKKTFFFIPPKAKHLKAYEDWNNSHQQNFTFLPHITKECYRVDLSEGDTMLIPSGWIHAVWTPANSLVIGGNFLTRMHYATQFRIVDIEKANNTPLKFRYPMFQKVMWYSVLKYLSTDPLPVEVADMFQEGKRFLRKRPTWHLFNTCDPDAAPDSEELHARYYSQAELDGLPELANFIFRTVMISLGRIEGVTEKSRGAVIRSIPKSQGDPLQVARTFALWVAWKRGNEDPPAWAHPDAVLPNIEGAEQKKLSAKTMKQLQRQEAFEAFKVAPDRKSARQLQQQIAKAETTTGPSETPDPTSQTDNPSFMSTPKTSVLGPKRIACDACRRRRIKCKHKEGESSSAVPSSMTGAFSATTPMAEMIGNARQEAEAVMESKPSVDPTPRPYEPLTESTAPAAPMMAAQTMDPHAVTPRHSQTSAAHSTASATLTPALPGTLVLGDSSSKPRRSKACVECRKSKASRTSRLENNVADHTKRRCVHDENGEVDPTKAEQTPVPRVNATKKRRSEGETSSSTKSKRTKMESFMGASMLESNIDPMLQQYAAEASDGMQENINVYPRSPYEPFLRTSLPETDVQNDAIVSDAPPQGTEAPETSYSELQRSLVEAIGADDSTEPLDQISQQLDVQQTLADTDMVDGDREPPPEAGQSMPVEPDANHDQVMESNNVPSDDRPEAVMSSIPSQENESAMEQTNEQPGEVVTAQDVQEPEAASDQTVDLKAVSDQAEPLKESVEPVIVQHTAPSSNHSASTSTEDTPRSPLEPAMQSSESVQSHQQDESIDTVLSDASSPLTEPAESPEPEPLDIKKERVEVAARDRRQSSRHSKPIERLGLASKETAAFASPVAIKHDVTKRKSQTPASTKSINPTQSGQDAVIVKAQKQTKGKAVTPAPAERMGRALSGSPKKTGDLLGVGDPKNEEDEESLRLVRELTGQSFGLRRR